MAPSRRRWCCFSAILYGLRELAPGLHLLHRPRAGAHRGGGLPPRPHGHGAPRRRRDASSSPPWPRWRVGIFLGVRALLPFIHEIRTEGRDYAEHLLEHPIVGRLRHLAGTREGGGGAAETVKAHAIEALHYATSFAHLALYLAHRLRPVDHLPLRARRDRPLAPRPRPRVGLRHDDALARLCRRRHRHHGEDAGRHRGRERRHHVPGARSRSGCRTRRCSSCSSS